MNLEKVILSQAMFYIEEKNQEKAVEYLLLAMKLAGTLRDEPLLISQAVLIVSHELINNVLIRILEDFSLTDEQCQQLLDEFTKHKQFEYGKSIIVEQLLSLRRQKGLCDGTIDPSQFNLPWYYVSPLRKQDYGIELEHVYDEIGLHSKPLGLTKYRASAAVITKWQTYDYPRFAMLSRMAFPIYSGIEDDSTLRLARLELARAALAIQIYHNRNKKLPMTLTTLVDEKILESDLIDPFSEKVLRYNKTEANSYTIYSVGKNTRDDGGLPKDSEFIDDFALHLTLPE